MARVSCYSTLFCAMLVVVVSLLAAGPTFSFQYELSSTELVSYVQEAKDLALAELEKSSQLPSKDLQSVSYFRQQTPYVFVTICFLIPPPQDGFVENKKIMLHLLGRLVPQNRYALFNISTTRDSTPAIGGGYCNGTVWDHDAYREKCTYCTNFLLTDEAMFPNCTYTTGVGVGFDLSTDHLVNCQLAFSPAF